MTSPIFYTATGLLTNYALACGYVETKNGYRLEKDGCYHVKGNGIWTTASTLTEARKKFNKLAKHIHEWEDVCGIDGETLVGAECLDCELFLDRGDFI